MTDERDPKIVEFTGAVDATRVQLEGNRKFVDLRSRGGMNFRLDTPSLCGIRAWSAGKTRD